MQIFLAKKAIDKRTKIEHKERAKRRSVSKTRLGVLFSRIFTAGFVVPAPLFPKAPHAAFFYVQNSRRRIT
jgi:hypothetical protein